MMPATLTPDRYNVDLHWTVVQLTLSWQAFSWAGKTRMETYATWAERVGCPKLSPSVLESLFYVETALVQSMANCHGPPPLDAYPYWRNQTADGVVRLLHHEAWPPLALNLALSGDEMVPVSPVPLFSRYGLAERQFRLWSEIPATAPSLPSPRPEGLPLAGSWLLETGDLGGLPLSKSTPRLLYTADGHMAASLRLPVELPFVGFRVDYSGRWFTEVCGRLAL